MDIDRVNYDATWLDIGEALDNLDWWHSECPWS